MIDKATPITRLTELSGQDTDVKAAARVPRCRLPLGCDRVANC
jgi:hypothetical protein